MLFNSIPFILAFLPAVALGYYAFRHFGLFQLSLGWLSLASLFFYAWWSPEYLALLLGSISVNFFIGREISRTRNSKSLLVAGISANLIAIGIYKYLGFFASTLNHIGSLSIPVPDLLLPLAISFFTFQQIAYLVDTYRSGRAEYRFDRYLLFVAFFPQLIAGPIVHHKDVNYQFSRISITSVPTSQISTGIFLFTIGLAKKVLIADQLAVYATPVFSAADTGSTPTFLEAWGGLLAYSFQLYFDFSGYADMAVGLAKIFGIDLPINFNSPYKSKNIIDFWRRWHITLSSFLRDYLYIPLGGSKKGSKSFNLVVTMLLGGLWHGAGWNFVIWGGLHGLYLIINHQWLAVKSAFSNYTLATTSGTIGTALLSTDETTDKTTTTARRSMTVTTIFTRAPAVLTTFFVVTLAWAFFRAETVDGALAIIQGILGLHGLSVPDQIHSLMPGIIAGFAEATPGTAIGSFPHIKGFVIIGLAMAIAFFAPNSNQISNRLLAIGASPQAAKFANWQTYGLMWIAGVIFIICVKLIATAPDSEFLYFNF